MRLRSVLRVGVLLLLAQNAPGFEVTSAHYRIRGGNLNGGGHAAMVSTAPVPKIGALGGSIGQAEALGWSGSLVSLRTIAPGFWPIVAGGFPNLDADLDVIQAFRDDCVDDLDVIAHRNSLADPVGSALSLAGTEKPRRSRSGSEGDLAPGLSRAGSVDPPREHAVRVREETTHSLP